MFLELFFFFVCVIAIGRARWKSSQTCHAILKTTFSPLYDPTERQTLSFLLLFFRCETLSSVLSDIKSRKVSFVRSMPLRTEWWYSLFERLYYFEVFVDWLIS